MYLNVLYLTRSYEYYSMYSIQYCTYVRVQYCTYGVRVLLVSYVRLNYSTVQCELGTH